MKILLAVPYSPYPVRRGFDRLMTNLVDGLIVDHEVVLVTMTFTEEERDSLRKQEKEHLKIASMIAPNKRSLAGRMIFKIRYAVRYMLKGIVPEVSYASPGKYIRLVADLARAEDPDLIISSYWHLYMLPVILPRFRHLLVTLDLDYLVAPSRLKFARGKRSGKRTPFRDRMRERTEKKAYDNFDMIMTVTEKDADILRKEYRGKKKQIETLPVSLDLKHFDRRGRIRVRDRILLTGTHLSDFNRDALRFFILDVLPIIRKKRPSAVLHVVGSVHPVDMESLKGENIEYCGYVSDLSSSLAEASVLVIPLRFGGGIRIRMLEAAAVGTPVVSTPTGVEGMGLVDGREYLEAGSPEDIAAAVLRLLDDDDLAGELGKNARVWMEKNYSDANYSERLKALFEKIIDKSEK
ncbi:MAG: glycosyltransferase family 4 protein [Candidatus Krumholzibacteriota bacterium]|nr:glycosyltransferase family 4 protein [Candidatus Krumholzibacteriota bacterium]